MNKARYIRVLPSRLLLGFALALLLAGSFFLPNIVAGVIDARTLDVTTHTDTQGFSFDTSPMLGVPERIDLIANRNIESIPIKTGRAMDTPDAMERAKSELSLCFSGGPLKFDYTRCAVTEGGAMFVINTADPSVNMIVWEFILEDSAGNMMMITLDDETGVIIKVIYRRETAGDVSDLPGEDELYRIARELTGMMADYYGMPVVLSDYMLSGDLAYYKADLNTGDNTIPMYGIVKATSFTMNEQA